MSSRGRRSFLKTGCASLAGLASAGLMESQVKAVPLAQNQPAATGTPPPFKLGLVTYELAAKWDIPTIIKNCEQTGFEGVELRTTHRHGVEPSISKARRAEVRQQFEASKVRLVSLGSTCQYESPDQSVVRRNIEETKRFCELAHDLNAIGVKVRPNGPFPPGVPHDKTLEQIGRALAECGDAARNLGIEIWLEVHGEETELPANIRRIMEVANHPAVGVCWNSNDTDVMDGSVRQSFDLLKSWLRSCHINELWRTRPPWQGVSAAPSPNRMEGFPEWRVSYLWRELFMLFRSIGYNRYTFAEVPPSCEPVRFMHYYRALWEYHAA